MCSHHVEDGRPCGQHCMPVGLFCFSHTVSKKNGKAKLRCVAAYCDRAFFFLGVSRSLFTVSTKPSGSIALTCKCASAAGKSCS